MTISTKHTCTCPGVIALKGTAVFIARTPLKNREYLLKPQHSVAPISYYYEHYPERDFSCTRLYGWNGEPVCACSKIVHASSLIIKGKEFYNSVLYTLKQ